MRNCVNLIQGFRQEQNIGRINMITIDETASKVKINGNLVTLNLFQGLIFRAI